MSAAAVLDVTSSTQQSSYVTLQKAGAASWERTLLTLAVDLVTLTSIGWVMNLVLPTSGVRFLSIAEVLQLIVPLVMLCAGGLYSTGVVHPANELRRLICSMALATIILAATEKYSSAAAAQMAFGIGFLLRAGVMSFARLLLRSFIIRHRFWMTRTVVVGSGALAESVVATLNRNRNLGLQPVALFKGTSPTTRGHREASRMGSYEAAAEFAKQHKVDHIVVAEAELSPQEIEELTYRFQSSFERVLFVPNYPSIATLSVNATDLGGQFAVELSHNLSHSDSRFVKRAFDLLVTSLVGLATLPVFVALALAVRFTSDGPIFYGQRRMGRNGRLFKAWKFRSMVSNADAVLTEHLAKDPGLRQEWELTHKLRNDPRVLPVGQFLRLTSLDELPQLWNVLRGEMSLVGPRPIVEAEAVRYGRCIDYYKAVQPGVTGMWQISGRSNTSYAERVEFDEYFVKNWSIWLDIYILFRTVKTVLFREGAC